MSMLRGNTSPLPKQILIHRLFEENAKRANVRDKPAILFEDNQLSFQQLNIEANKLSRYLVQKIDSRKSADQQCIIGVQMEPSHRTIVALLAVLKVGGAYLPIDPSLPKERLRHILVDGKPLCVLTDTSTSTIIEDVLFLPVEEYLKAELKSACNTEDLRDSEGLSKDSPQLFSVIYTSGSTGTPKGICLPHRAVYNRLSWQWRQFPFTSSEVCCWKTSLSFVDSIAEIFAPLLQGIPLITPPRNVATNAEKLIDVLDKYSVSRLTLVPSLLKMILLLIETRSNKDCLLTLKVWVCSGEVLPTELLMEFFEKFPQGHVLSNFYGSTEVMGDVTFETFVSADDASRKIHNEKVPIGRPIDNTTVYLVDDKLQLVSPGEVGEIFVSSLNLATGTLSGNDTSFIETVLVGNQKETFYKTGDFGRIVNNTIFNEGRKDSQLKIRGFRIDLAEIEAVIKETDGISSVVVLCHNLNSSNPTIVAFYVKRKKASLENILKSNLEKYLPNYMHPVLFEVKTIPLLPASGKVDRQALLTTFESSKGISCLEEQVNAVNENLRSKASALLKTVSSVLGPLPNEALHSSFFELGGNSLNVIMVLRQLIKEGYSLDMAHFLKSPTLLDVLDGMKECGDINTQVPRTTSVFKKGVSFVSTKNIDKYEGSDLIGRSFASKGMFEQTIQRLHGGYEVLRRHYRETCESVWETCTNDYHSFAAIDSEGKMQAVSLFVSLEIARNVRPDDYGITMAILLRLCRILLDKSKDQIPKEGNILYSFAVGVNPELPSAESLEVITAVEEENVRLAKEKGYTGIISINVSPVTQQLTEFVLGYRVVARVQGNQCVFADGSRPFALCPDDQMATLAINIF